MFERSILQTIVHRMGQPRHFVQVLAGPRQTGKTTIARQLAGCLDWPSHYASADEPALKDRIWIEQQWEVARLRSRNGGTSRNTLLVLDEIQKIPGWSETVKRLWDEDSVHGSVVHVVVLGSSPLLVQQGLTESLAGRFEIVPVTHWSFGEMRDAFGWDVDRYLYYGGYPGAAALVDEPARWSAYVRDSLMETSISRDVLLLTRVDRPALLRRLFDLGCSYSGQVLSYQKMTGQLQDSGNTTTLAHYLDLLHGAGLLRGLSKYSAHTVRQRASSPKLLALNTALVSVSSGLTFEEARQTPDFWGRLVESGVGASLANGVMGKNIGLFYWNGRNREVDFVLRRGHSLVAIEVKSGRRRTALPGLDVFCQEFPVTKKLLVGAQGVPMGEFLLTPVETWLE